MLRNSVFDNAKLMMIFLVVFGHLVEPIINQGQMIKIIYISIFSFHMPVFIILAGVFATLDVSESVVLNNIKSLLIPLLVFTVLYEVYNLAVERSISGYTLNWRPYWILWFLFSLFIWKLMLPIIMKFKYPLLLSIMISLCAGYVVDVGYFLGVSRTLYFFPFYILGFKLGPAFLSNRFLLKIPRRYFFIVLAVNVLGFWLFNNISHQWLYGSFSYARLGSVEWFSFVSRVMLYFISVTTSIAIIMVMPSREFAITVRGKNSLFVYLWHGFFVNIAVYFGLIQALGYMSDGLALVTLFIAAILITALLSCDIVANLTRRFLFVPAQRLLLTKSQEVV